MVFDMNFRSHPHKALEKHIDGVLRKTEKRTDLEIAKVAVLFHDLGKINPNFQKKLEPENKGKDLGYSEHAYLSAYVFLCYCTKNSKSLLERTGATNMAEGWINILQILVIIAKHHGNLPDLEDFFKINLDDRNPLVRLKKFIANENTDLPISEFYSQKLEQNHQSFLLNWNDKLLEAGYFSNNKRNTWHTKALDYFLDTQYAFASLVESDKRDAGDLEEYNLDEKIEANIQTLQEALRIAFDGLAQNTELNLLRTQIREEAVQNLADKLQYTKERVFTLTAPTGAGKTFTLLALAKEIQRQRGNLGILYALPFLSITEQVQAIVEKNLSVELLSVSSKSRNERIEAIQAALDEEPSEENLIKLLKEDFFQQTFDHPFVLTTFVQFFETLMSNKNATLLKLPNFKNRIFLIDEVQALPPQLYIFFTAWLQAFCKKNNSYCILSTATMPCFEIPDMRTKQYAKEFFKSYESPNDLLEAKKYFEADIFRRYQINWLSNDKINLDGLAAHVRAQAKSCLIILNTIDDSKNLFEKLNNEPNTYLLNTHFIPADRRKKIEIVKSHLENDEKVILISTQLIEAGVDIDFPIVYRDLCPLPSLIQSAGRCNRNKKLALGQVYFFHLVDDNGKSRANLIYRDINKVFLNFCKNKISDGLQENQLFDIQGEFFRSIANDLTISETVIFNYKTQQNEKIRLIDCVNEAKFETLGTFKLIQKEFGEEYQYYIPIDEYDTAFQEAEILTQQVIEAKTNRLGYKVYKQAQSNLETHLKNMAERIITIRIPEDKYSRKEAPNYSAEVLGMRALSDLNDYSFELGLRLESETFL